MHFIFPFSLHYSNISSRGVTGMCALYLCSQKEVQRLLLGPNKAFYVLNRNYHMEQVLPEACLGEVQVIVRPYVQFIRGSDLPSNVPRCCHGCQAC